MSVTEVGGGRREGFMVSLWTDGRVVSLWGGGPREGGGGARDPTAGRLTMVSALVTHPWLFLSPTVSCLLARSSWLVV